MTSKNWREFLMGAASGAIGGGVQYLRDKPRRDYYELMTQLTEERLGRSRAAGEPVSPEETEWMDEDLRPLFGDEVSQEELKEARDYELRARPGRRKQEAATEQKQAQYDALKQQYLSLGYTEEAADILTSRLLMGEPVKGAEEMGILFGERDPETGRLPWMREAEKTKTEEGGFLDSVGEALRSAADAVLPEGRSVEDQIVELEGKVELALNNLLEGEKSPEEIQQRWAEQQEKMKEMLPYEKLETLRNFERRLRTFGTRTSEEYIPGEDQTEVEREMFEAWSERNPPLGEENLPSVLDRVGPYGRGAIEQYRELLRKQLGREPTDYEIWDALVEAGIASREEQPPPRSKTRPQR
ncbi:MAG: hypothetical protein GY937_20145 [bacterium]|nr:hypothetical protein [bacterium]